MIATGVKVRVGGHFTVLFYSGYVGSTAVGQTRHGTMSPLMVKTTVAPDATGGPPVMPGRSLIVLSAVVRTLLSSVPF